MLLLAYPRVGLGHWVKICVTYGRSGQSGSKILQQRPDLKIVCSYTQIVQLNIQKCAVIYPKKLQLTT